MGTSTPKGAGVEARIPRKARLSQEWPWMIWEWPWMSRWSGVSVGLHQEYPRVMKLVIELHHVSQGSNQGEFQDGGASM